MQSHYPHARTTRTQTQTHVTTHAHRQVYVHGVMDRRFKKTFQNIEDSVDSHTRTLARTSNIPFISTRVSVLILTGDCTVPLLHKLYFPSQSSPQSVDAKPSEPALFGRKRFTILKFRASRLVQKRYVAGDLTPWVKSNDCLILTCDSNTCWIQECCQKRKQGGTAEDVKSVVTTAQRERRNTQYKTSS